ncbi:MAG TPA: site-specific integrase [Candidatus Acidoferrum sp.]
MIEDMQLHGLSENTQELYVRAVSQLSQYVHRGPDKVTEEDIRRFFLYLANEKKAARSTATVALCGIKFFYENTLRRDWPTLQLVRPAREHKLPVVLSRDEVHRVLAEVQILVYRACLKTIYSCGLRLMEGVRLQVADVDSERMVLHIHGGKGKRDRYVALPKPTLIGLRECWKTHGSRQWLFPARNSKHAGEPITGKTLQRAFSDALQRSGITKKAHVHSLRHAYATHLLEVGVNLRLIQETLGHRNPQTTAIYAHLTQPVRETMTKHLDELMKDL